MTRRKAKPTFDEFDIVVRVRGIDLDPKKAADLIEAILSREMDHNADEWGSENRVSFMVPDSTPGDGDEPEFYPGDEHYE